MQFWRILDSQFNFTPTNYELEKLAAFFEPRGIVRQERGVHEVGELFLARDIPGQDALARKVLLLVRAALLLKPIGHFPKRLRANGHGFFQFWP